MSYHAEKGGSFVLYSRTFSAPVVIYLPKGGGHSEHIQVGCALAHQTGGLSA